MEDSQLVQLFWDRDERAIPATAEVYGNYCFTVAHNILDSTQDAEECVNDTWLHAWNAIPPQRPKALSPFLARITRNLALHMLRRNRAKKRGGGEIELVFEELAECVSGRDWVEQAVDERELTRAINEFLAGLPAEKRIIFVRRYWYTERVATIAKGMGMTENRVSVTLHRLREALRTFLEERGFRI